MTSHPHIKKLLIAPFFSAVLVLSGCGSDLSDIEYVQKAKDFQDKGDIVSAIIELKNAANKNPKNPEARLILGKIYLDNENGPAAEKELGLAIKLGINDLNLKLDLFESYLLQGKFEKVIADLELSKFTESDAVRSRAYLIKGTAFLEGKEAARAKILLEKSLEYQDNASARVALIKILLVTGETKNASQSIEQSLAVYPNDFDLLLVTGDYYLFTKNIDQAISFYSKALAIKGTQPALLRRADLYVLKNNIPLAEKDVSSVLQINPNHPMANFIKGKIKYSQKNYEEAQQLLEQVVRALPNQMNALALLGIVNYHLGYYEQSVKYLEKYNNRLPGNADVQRLLGEVYVRLGRGEEAILILKNLASRAAEDPGLYLALGNAYAKSHDYKRAQENFTIAKKLAPDESAISNKIAALKIQSGENTEAVNDLETILSGAEINKQAEILLVWALVRSGQYDKALEYANKAVGRNPQDAKNLFVRGFVYQRKKDVELAKEDFLAANELVPEFFMPLIGLADIAFQQKKHTEAKQYFNKVLELKKDHLGSLMGLALIEEQSGNWQAMETQLIHTISLRPDTHQPVEKLVDYYLQSGELEKADAIAGSYQDNNPESAYGFLTRAKTYVANQNFIGAEAQLRNYLSKNERDISKRMTLVEVLRRQPNIDEAINQSDLLIKYSNNNLIFVGAKISLMIEAGLLEDAVAELEVLKDSNNKQAKLIYYGLSGDLNAKNGEFVAAIKNYQKAYDIDQETKMLEKLVRLDLHLKNIAHAESRIKKHLDAKPKDYKTRVLWASFHEQKGKFAEAENEYLEVISAQPNNVVALNNLALLYSKQGKSESAVEMAKKAYKLLPSAEIMDTYGWVLMNSGKFQEAIFYLERALDRLPSNEEIAFHLVVALRKAGRSSSADAVATKITSKKYLELLK